MQHEPDEFRFEWNETVAGIYADVVGDADPDEGVQRDEAFRIAAEKIHQLVDDGDLKPAIDEVIKAALVEADRKHGRRADRIIRDTVRGQIDLGIPDDPTLRTVVTLGGGLRKLWQDVTEDDLLAMDENRFSNLRSQQDAYTEWRAHFEPARRVLRKHHRVLDAVRAGAFTPDEDFDG